VAECSNSEEDVEQNGLDKVFPTGCTILNVANTVNGEIRLQLRKKGRQGLQTANCSIF
jgi:hypothetical protein